ncbi:ExbD/TolR family protein [Stakelama marina]|uniref:Biopolymer transporter ExbD n=1 Tax=Stakelama marina TaxID=2826939 RepID=A0A8T4IFU0_9SPHN|nr:biopolymer transporter ExbD [Stakelama marina]MBR0553453.1 biopolymer transporter ExbD [Stakelama marina]
MRRFATTAPAADLQPIQGINTTPLIDVMLVLLVMFILAVPAAMHEVPVNLPQPAPASDPVRHLLAIDRGGAMRLDGAALSDAALATRLPAIADDPQALLVLKTDPEARYERFDQVLAGIKRAGITRLGFEGNRDLAW